MNPPWRHDGRTRVQWFRGECYDTRNVVELNSLSSEKKKIINSSIFNTVKECVRNQVVPTQY